MFVEDYAKNIPIHQGVFVDIYPHDVAPGDPKLREKQQRSIAFWQQVFIAKDIARVTTSRSRLKKLLGGMFRGAVHLCLLPVPKGWIFKKLDDAMRRYAGEKSDYTITLDTPTGVRRLDEVFPLKQGMFEGILVNIPNQPETLLERDYGDYMQLPTEADRVGHCPALFDLGEQLK